MENELAISNDFLENQTLLEKLTSIDSLKIQEPVILCDGYTYEKVWIEEWLKSHNISPITKLKLAHKDLIPNHTLKQLQFKCQQLSKENESLKMHPISLSEQFIQTTHFINTLKENIKQHEELMETMKNQEGIIQHQEKSVEKIEAKLVKENPQLSVNIIFLLWCFKSYNKLEKNKSPVPKPIQHNIFNFFFQGVNEFVYLVYSGNLKAVEKILQEHPNLAFVQTDIKDLSNREFKRMSGFQYAAWSLDSEMWTLMLQYVDKKRAAYQFHELQHDRLDITNYHDLHIDFNSLIKVYQDYVNYVDNRYSRKYKGVEVNDPTRYWMWTIGPAQQKVPAWFIYAFCEPGDYVAWTKGDFNKKVIRQTDKNLVTRWMEEIKQGNGWYRGFEVTKGAEVFHRYLTNKTANIEEQESICLRRELKNTQQLVSKQIEELNKLKILFENELKSEINLNFKNF